MNKTKYRVFDVIQIGNRADSISRFFDYFIVICIITNILVTFGETFDELEFCMSKLQLVEGITCGIFVVEYVLRVWTADLLHPEKKPFAARAAYIFSFFGIVDLLSSVPYFLPFVFPSGIVAFRLFRVVRIFRLFRVNAQYDAFNIIVDVLKEKKDQIISSVLIILTLMIASSMIMYSLEHTAQPDNFKNAFSGIWWSVSTLLTVGYGDIYPITPLGRVMAIIIAFLGVGIVSIPTAIISAGFVEQYTKVKRIENYADEHRINFTVSKVVMAHPWIGKMIKEIIVPPNMIIALIIRDEEELVPRGDTILEVDDEIVFCAESLYPNYAMEIKEIIIKSEHEWIGEKIRDIDISRQELIFLIRRKNKTIIPNGNTVIHKGDLIMMYVKHTRED